MQNAELMILFKAIWYSTFLFIFSDSCSAQLSNFFKAYIKNTEKMYEPASTEGHNMKKNVFHLLK